MRTINGLEELKAAEGEHLGTSEWHEVTQEAVDRFAEITGDHQWIHVDVERAKQTPFGGTIAHGYFTLALGPMLSDQVMKLHGFTYAVNYGLDKVRFPAPMPVGGRVRVHLRLADLKPVPGGAQFKLELTFEREGEEKPVCVAETLARVYAGDPAEAV
jgi:acyl dehydratase